MGPGRTPSGGFPPCPKGRLAPMNVSRRMASTTRNILLGFLAGLVLAAILALIGVALGLHGVVLSMFIMVPVLVAAPFLYRLPILRRLSQPAAGSDRP